MSCFKWNSIIVLIIVEGLLCEVTSQCPSPFISDSGTNFCYYTDRSALSWSDGYNQCLNEPFYGSYMEIHSKEQWEDLQKLPANDFVWLGANNFASCMYKKISSRMSRIAVY